MNISKKPRYPFHAIFGPFSRKLPESDLKKMIKLQFYLLLLKIFQLRIPGITSFIPPLPTLGRNILWCASSTLIGLLRVSEYSDIRGSEYKIEYGYSSLPKSLDRDLFSFFFFYLFVTETRSFSQNNPLKFFTLTTVLIDNISYLNTFVSCRLVTSFIGN